MGLQRDEGPETPVVYVVEDDDSMRYQLTRALGARGWEVRAYETGADFFDCYDPKRRGCVVLDNRLPGMSGTAIQRRLNAWGASPPVIFISAYGDIPTAVEAMRDGAIDFLEKPFGTEQLINRLERALAADDARRATRVVATHLARLTAREREVLDLVVGGQTNKSIATRLGLHVRTVEAHRRSVMAKMQAGSIANLVRIVVEAGVWPAPPGEPSSLPMSSGQHESQGPPGSTGA